MNHKTAALIGGLFVAPFVAANALVGHRVEPFFSFIRPGPQTSPFEYVLLGLVLGCLPPARSSLCVRCWREAPMAGGASTF